MKRINILLSQKTLRDSISSFLILGLGFPLVLRLIVGPSPYHILGLIFLPPLSLFVAIAPNSKLPLYLEYDNEKIIAYYPFGKRAVVSRTHTIYTGYTKRDRVDICTVFSNTPFRTSYINTIDFDAPKNLRFVLHIDRTSQIIIPQEEFPEAMRLFPLEMRVPVEKVDWDVLTQAPTPTKPAKSPPEQTYMLPTFLEHLAALAAGCIGLIALLIGFIVYLLPSFLIAFFFFGGLWISAAIKASKNLRFCAKVHFHKDSVMSTLFRKTQCTANLTQPVYYAIFRSGEYGSEGLPYIVISNEWFNYYPIIDDHRSYLSVYDSATQIVFPYNAETAAICDFDNWHCVGGFGELNMKRSKTPN